MLYGPRSAVNFGAAQAKAFAAQLEGDAGMRRIKKLLGEGSSAAATAAAQTSSSACASPATSACGPSPALVAATLALMAQPPALLLSCDEDNTRHEMPPCKRRRSSTSGCSSGSISSSSGAFGAGPAALPPSWPAAWPAVAPAAFAPSSHNTSSCSDFHQDCEVGSDNLSPLAPQFQVLEVADHAEMQPEALPWWEMFAPEGCAVNSDTGDCSSDATTEAEDTQLAAARLYLSWANEIPAAF